jgi:hypothetical protein
MEDFVIVEWPESQYIMDMEWFYECELVNDEELLEIYGSSAYFVPKERYYELENSN